MYLLGVALIDASLEVQSPLIHRSESPQHQSRPFENYSRTLNAEQSYNNRAPAFPPYNYNFHPHSHIHPHAYPHPPPQYYNHHALNHLQAPTYINPASVWDPTISGAVPGYWQASFDPTVQRWVHTWQPQSSAPFF